jgi:hypothetical protein
MGIKWDIVNTGGGNRAYILLEGPDYVGELGRVEYTALMPSRKYGVRLPFGDQAGYFDTLEQAQKQLLGATGYDNPLICQKCHGREVGRSGVLCESCATSLGESVKEEAKQRKRLGYVPSGKRGSICDVPTAELKAFIQNIGGQNVDDELLKAATKCKLPLGSGLITPVIPGVEFNRVPPGEGSLDPHQVYNDLEKSMQDENMAVEAYHIRAMAAEFFGDYETKALYEHIIGEEKQHAKEFTERRDALIREMPER